MFIENYRRIAYAMNKNATTARNGEKINRTWTFSGTH